MELSSKTVKKVYFRYLSAAFGSAMISSIYGLVDMAMVGQYQGPDGTAALAVVAPVWNLMYSLGLLMGIGGSVLFGTARGRGGKREKEFFSAAVWGTVALAVFCWIAVVCFERPMLVWFGADEQLLVLAQEYLEPIKIVVPLFLGNQMLAAFLRNDGAPGLATAAVLSGGIFNVVGDYLFVFAWDKGVWGAGLATALGAAITFTVMLTHFFSRHNTLRMVKVSEMRKTIGKISVAGFSTFFSDVAMGILTMLFNRQIMKYAGTDALAVYGIIVNISTIVQCCGYSVGQAAQPILSFSFGAKKWTLIRKTFRYAIGTAVVFGILWTAAAFIFPIGFVHIFMTPTSGVLKIAPSIIRCYGVSFLLLPLNVFSTYYFQAIMKPNIAFVVSTGRGALVSGCLIQILPILWGASALWWAMPITEFVVAVFVLWKMMFCAKEFST